MATDENKSKGFIKIFRSFLEWEWHDDPNAMTLFIHCLLLANYRDNKWHGIDVPRGSFVSSIASLAKITGLSEKSVRTAIKHLKEAGNLASKSTNKYTLFTVQNYDLYQDGGKQTGDQEAGRGQADGKQRATIKEIKKSRKKEVNKIDDHSDCVADDLGEVFSVVEKNFSQDVAIAFKRFATHWDQKPPTRDELEAWLYVLMELKTDADRLACVKWSSGENPKGAWYRKLYTTGYRTPYGSKEPPTEPNLPDWYAEVPEEKATKKEIDAVIALQKAVAAGDAVAAERIQATILGEEINEHSNPIN